MNFIRVLDVSEWSSGDNKFDVISCLNVLDRCQKPLTLLNQIKSSLNPGGVAVIAFVIPFKPYVEFGGNIKFIFYANCVKKIIFKKFEIFHCLSCSYGFSRAF